MTGRRRVRARRETDPEMKRTRRTPLSANDPEWDLIEAAARMDGLPTTTWIRMVALKSANRVVGPRVSAM